MWGRMLAAVKRVNRRGAVAVSGGGGSIVEKGLGRRSGARGRKGGGFVEVLTEEDRVRRADTVRAMKRERELDVESEDEGVLMVMDQQGRRLLSAEIRARVREAFGVEEPAAKRRRRWLKEVADADQGMKSGGVGSIDPALAVAIARRRRASGQGVPGHGHARGHGGRKAALGARIRFTFR